MKYSDLHGDLLFMIVNYFNTDQNNDISSICLTFFSKQFFQGRVMLKHGSLSEDCLLLSSPKEFSTDKIHFHVKKANNNYNFKTTTKFREGAMLAVRICL